MVGVDKRTVPIERDVFYEELDKKGQIAGLSLTEEQKKQLTDYYEQLVTVNRTMNLTAITLPDEIVIKHIIDSLSCYDEMHFAGKKVLDLGTGAGFPGIPLAIYDKSLQITLFDSLQKRLRFLEEVSQQINLQNVTFLHGRAEELAHNKKYREGYAIVTSRAVARLPVLLEWALPYVAVGGYFISLKGAAYEDELRDSQKALSLLGGQVEEVRPVQLPGLMDKRAVIYIKKVKATPKSYPRKVKEIKEHPLGVSRETREV